MEAPPRDKKDEESQNGISGKGSIQHLKGIQINPFTFWPKTKNKNKEKTEIEVCDHGK